tara:strand:+ start:23 stop:349 length:327 start_codon:yes stop_codon:yes gene_type:complete
MESIHHKPIKLYNLEGNIYDDSILWRLRIEYADLLIAEMRFAGYVPRLDIDEDFTIEYNENIKGFKFKLSMYGIHVGKRKSEWIFGVDGTLVIPMHQSKSNESWQEVA